MSILDAGLERESACPVHFIWDGRGAGRPFVRVGFLVLVVAAVLASGATVLHVGALKDAAALTAAAGAASWLLGHGLARISRRRR